MRSFPMVSASSIGASVRYVAKQAGCEGAESVLRRARLPLELAAVTQYDARFIPLRSLLLVLEAASDVAKLRNFGVELVQQRGITSAGSLFSAAEQSDELGRALELVCRTSKAYSNQLHLELRWCGDLRCIGFATSLGNSPGARQLTELVLAALVALVRRFAGNAWQPLRIETDFANDATAGAALERFARCPLVHGQSTAGVVLDEPVWTSRMPRTPEPSRLQEQERLPPSDFTSAVRELIRLCLLDTDCSLLLVARTMGISARTLQRELNHAGCTFRRLVLAERCARAAELLVETRSAIDEIAVSSGYSSHNHLARAFKRLELVSPGQYRSQMSKAKSC